MHLSIYCLDRGTGRASLVNQTSTFRSAGCTTSPARWKTVWGLWLLAWHLQECVQNRSDRSAVTWPCCTHKCLIKPSLASVYLVSLWQKTGFSDLQKWLWWCLCQQRRYGYYLTCFQVFLRLKIKIEALACPYSCSHQELDIYCILVATWLCNCDSHTT